MSPLLRRLLAAAIAVAAVAIAAPAAQADSIAYVKGGNVWLSTGDGTRQYQVTSTGGYSDVSQADDGTMIALRGVRLHRLNRQGTVLADFATPVSDTRPAGQRVFFGPYDPAISPDGTKVAYTYYYMTQTQDPTCYPPECVVAINEGGTGYTRADRLTPWDTPGYRKHSGWRYPTWVDNTMTMMSDPTHLPNHDVVLDKPDTNPVGLVRNWFSDTLQGNPHVSEGDITRDKRKMAFVTGSNDSTLTLYHVPRFPTSWQDSEPNPGSLPTACYRYDGAKGKFATPTFSPDGSRLAWAESDGIKVVTVPSFAAGCSVEGASPTSTMLIPGASQPDWGPANVPTGRPAPPPDDPGELTAAVKKRALGKALRKGLALTVDAPGAGTVVATAHKGGRRVARGSKRVSAGAATVKLRFTKAARRALKAKRRLKLRVKVAYTPDGGDVQRQTLAITLKR
jgi:hypothetical protein